ncbi:MAG: recombination protein O N-terminal domain-containing protein [Treponema sp.]|jgi:DNA repair protein RecO (recombination protein O)|nr:recombination protein O N-terminal domain-containing protein [Treponema sp.]
MSRTAICKATILRSRASGESNRELSLLTTEQGVVKATVFGGPKSKLRAYASPYNSGRVWLYFNPVKGSVKVNDFDVLLWRPGLRELYERTIAAGAVADTILASHGGGGSWETAVTLADTALDALECANEEFCGRVLIHFLWQWAGFLGIRPAMEYCADCGEAAFEDAPLWFDAREGNVMCDSCASLRRNEINLLLVNPGCRRWFSAITPLEPSQAGRYSMDGKSFHEAKALATAVLSAALEKRLASWDW